MPNTPTQALLFAGIAASIAAGAPILAGVCAFFFWLGEGR